MRTTLDIDDDALEAARVLGRRTNKTAGATLFDLARRALTISDREAGMGRSRSVGGFVPFDRRGSVVTSELIDKFGESDAY